MNKTALRKINIAIIGLTVLVASALFFAGTLKPRLSGKGGHHEDSVSAFYDKATIKWIIPYNPGGGYDEYVRLIVPYLEKYTGARVHVRNISGAGGLRGFSEIFRSPADGLTIGLINGSGLITSQIAGISGKDLNIDELSFLGRVAIDTRVLALSEKSRYTSFADIVNAQKVVRIGATGLGGSTYLDAVIIRQIFDLNMNIIHGFDNSSSIQRAILGGDIDGTWSSWGSTLDAATSGRVKIVLQGGRTRSAALPDVPTVFELVGDTTDPSTAKNILTAWEALNDVGRPIVAPPGIGSDKREYLREAIKQALHDPQFLADAASAGRSIMFASGEETGDIVRNALLIPEDIQQHFIKAVRSGL